MKLIMAFGNMVSANRLVAIVSPESAPIKRDYSGREDRGTLIDATYGRRTARAAGDRQRPRYPVGRPAGDGGKPSERSVTKDDEEELNEDEA